MRGATLEQEKKVASVKRKDAGGMAVYEYIRGGWIVLGPDADVLVEVMRTKYRSVSSQVVEVVHYHRHE